MSGHPTCPLCGTANIAAPDESAVGFARCYLHGVYRDRPDVTATVTDPRHAAMTAVRNMAADWHCPFDGERQRIDCPECVARVALDAYEAVQRLDHGITS